MFFNFIEVFRIEKYRHLLCRSSPLPTRNTLRKYHYFTRHILLSLQISSTNDLLNEEFKFGVLKGSPIARTLELSLTDEHKKLWENINSHRHGLRDSNNDGIRRARWDEKYAFLIEGMCVKFLQIKCLCFFGFFVSTNFQLQNGCSWKFYSFLKTMFTIIVLITRRYSRLGAAPTTMWSDVDSHRLLQAEVRPCCSESITSQR